MRLLRRQTRRFGPERVVMVVLALRLLLPTRVPSGCSRHLSSEQPSTCNSACIALRLALPILVPVLVSLVSLVSFQILGCLVSLASFPFPVCLVSLASFFSAEAVVTSKLVVILVSVVSLASFSSAEAAATSKFVVIPVSVVSVVSFAAKEVVPSKPVRVPTTEHYQQGHPGNLARRLSLGSVPTEKIPSRLLLPVEHRPRDPQVFLGKP